MNRPATQHKRAAYPAYKPSGMNWVGDIPEHWEIHRLKHIASVQFSSVDKHTLEGEDPVRLCNYVDVYYNDFIAAGIEFMSASATQSEIARFQLCRGDVLVTKDSESWDDIAVPSYVAEKLDGVLCGYHLAHIRPHPRKLLGEYLFRAFRSRGINDQFRVAANGITRFGLGKYWLDNGLFPVPSLDEQRAIAAFLDRETARIDALIKKKRRQIELLQEKRSALISHAVTKGLDPNAPMKDSGIEWLGEIPEHWNVKKVKNLATKIGSGKTPKGGSEIYVDSGIMLLRSQNVHFEGLRQDDVVFIEPETDAEMASTRVFSEDVLLNITGASLGRCCIVPEVAGPANVNQHVCIIRARRDCVDPQYLRMSMCSCAVQSQIFASENGTSREGLNFQQISNLLVALPSDMVEQRAITSRLAALAQSIDETLAKIEASINLLREYRTALISAAVTGKIDVREEVA